MTIIYIMYDFWDMECDERNFLSCQTNICPFIPLTAPKIKIFKKIRKMPGDIIIWHMCNMNHVWLTWLTYDVYYEVWFLRYGPQRTEFFVILDHFLPFYTLTTQKIIILKKMKKNIWRYTHFKHVYPKSWLYVTFFLRLRCVMNVIFTFHFGLFFVLLQPSPFPH